MAVIGSLRANLGLDATSWVSSFRKAGQEIGNFSTRVNQATDLMTVSFNRAWVEAENFARRTPGMASQIGQLGGSVQNTARQMTDFAVQMSMATPFALVLTQQAPQLAAGFGVVGEVIGSLIAGAGLAYIVWSQRATEQSEFLKEELGELGNQAQTITSINRELSTSYTDLVAKFGANADAVRELIRLEADLAKLKFGEQQRAAIAAITDSLGEYNRALTGGEESAQRVLESFRSMQDVKAETEQLLGRPLGDNWIILKDMIDQVSDSLGSTRQEAASVVASLMDLNLSEGIEETSKAMATMATRMAEAAGGADKLEGEAAGIYRALIQASRAGFDAAAGISAAGNAAATSAAQAYAGASAYKEFAAAMELAALKRSNLQKAQGQAMADQAANRRKFADAEREGVKKWNEEVERAYVEGLRERTEAVLEENERQEDNLNRFVDRVGRAIQGVDKPKAGKKGGGGGKTEAEKTLEDLKRSAKSLWEETRTPLEQFQLKIQELNRLRETQVDGKALIDEETYIRGVKLAQEELEKLGETGVNVSENVRDSFTDALADILQGTQSFSEAMSSVLAQLGSQLVSTGIGSLLGAAFPKGGVIMDAIQGIMSPAKVASAASTGSVNPQAVGGLGGAVQSMVKIGLGDGLVGEIVGQAREQTLTIVDANNQVVDRALPSRIMGVTKDPRRR